MFKKLLYGLATALAVGTGITFAAFETPSAPLPVVQSSEFAHFDIQTHSRDSVAGFDGMNAQHGADCSGPPSTHFAKSFADSVFVCNGHVMTAVNAGGYGLAVLTPTQLLDCRSTCSVQWDMSTERLSKRDWPDVWITPWANNVTLPFDTGEVDLQGVPRNSLHIDLNDTENTWLVKQSNSSGVETEYSNRWGQPSIQSGIAGGTNQAATRQTFRVTISGRAVKVERLASSTASAQVYFNGNVGSSITGSDMVVQFAQHSYTPTKDGAGSPATWHWSGFQLTPSTPFTLIHAKSELVRSNGTLAFDEPAPAGAMLRFSGLCRVSIDGAVAPKTQFIGHYEHASSYFIPIAQGKSAVSVGFSADNWYGSQYSPGCYVQNAAIWAKGGSPSSTPSPTVIPLSPTPVPTSTSTPVAPTPIPTATSTMVPSPTATSVQSSPTPSSTPSASYLFQDEFNSLDPTKWAVADRTGDTSNSEQQCYRPQNVSVSGGVMSITASRANGTCNQWSQYGSFPYQSGMVNWSNFSFLYGRIEFRAKMAGGTGPWPAIWLLGTNCQDGQPTQAWYTDWDCNWPQPGADEIDIAEYLNHDFTHVNQQIHTSGSNQGCRPSVSNTANNWHTYAMDWRPGRLTFYVDGRMTCTIVSSQVPSTPKFLIMNVAVGGTGGGSVNASTLPKTMQIDYVRVSP